jgi:tRNA(fMet)-specific endonuclease VapC
VNLLRHLLDTNVLSRVVDDPFGRVSVRIQSHGIDTVCTSILVAAELRFGAAKSGSRRLAERVDRVLRGITVLPFEPPADRYYGELRSHLMREGRPIGPTDLFIAAHALALDLTLVTANVGEFSRVPDLRVENWLV